MSKINISFNNTNYSIDKSDFAPATSELRTHLSTVMNGSGATINFDEIAYNIDSAKLTAATNDFITHLGTIAGNGSTVVVNGREYSIDSTKLTSAISDIEAVLAGTGEERLGGDGSEYYTLAPTALSFRSTAPLNELQEIQINGITVDPSNYTLEEGSTIVTLPIEYLKNLNAGSYEISVASDSKTVNGSFTVKAPELNEYGFYYNKPYGYSDGAQFGWVGDTDLLFYEDGIVAVTELSTHTTDMFDYTISGNIVSVETFSGTVVGTISNDGKIITFGADEFVLGATSSCDDEFRYVYNAELGGNEVSAICKRKASYGTIRTGVNGHPTVSVAANGFAFNTAMETIDLLETITTIGSQAFYGCTSLVDIDLSNVKTVVGSAFVNCTSLKSVDLSNVQTIGDCAFDASSLQSVILSTSVTSIGYLALFTDNLVINYTGNEEQWNSISLGSGDAPSIHSTCTINYNYVAK